MVLNSHHPDLTIPDESFSSFALTRFHGYGDKVAMVDNTLGKSITFRQIYDQVRKSAGALRKQGLKHGDVAVIMAHSCIEFPVIMLAVMSCGATVATINPAYKKGEVLRQFNISEPCIVFADSQALDVVKEVAAEVNFIKTIFSLGKTTGLTAFESLVKNGDGRDFPTNILINSKEDVALLLYSSGTTGLSKSVMLTHYNLVASSVIMRIHGQFSRKTCFYSERPMFHVAGMFGIQTALPNGGTLVIDSEFEVERWLSAVQKYKVTDSIMVPPMMISVSQTPSIDKYDLSSLQKVVCGGASVAPSLISVLQDRLNAKVFEAYAMTESGVISWSEGSKQVHGSSGTIVANCLMKVIDLQTGKEIGPNENGEILVKGAQTMKGYMKNPEATANAIDSDGWLHTGDIGHYDEDGLLFIIDRLKEVIKYKTFQVPPAELETALLNHPKIADVGVVGIPDEYAGEIPKAFVVKSDESLTKEEVMNYVRDELTEYKHLHGGVEFTDVIPKSVTGKIQREQLKMAATGK